LHLSTNVFDFIVYQNRYIPSYLDNQFHVLRHLVQQVIILIDDKPDKLVWRGTTSGNMYFKESKFPQRGD